MIDLASSLHTPPSSLPIYVQFSAEKWLIQINSSQAADFAVDIYCTEI